MKKFFKVQQEEGTSVVQVDFCNDNRLSGRFAGVTVLKGPALTFGRWLCIFKKEILEKFSEDVERVLEEYSDFYKNAMIEAIEMFREGENKNWNKVAIRTAFEKHIGDGGCVDYRFIEKFYTDPLFEAGTMHVETFHVSMCNKVNRKPPKHIYTICTLWQYFHWNDFIEETSYTEFTPKEYDWNVEAPSVTVTDIIG